MGSMGTNGVVDVNMFSTNATTGAVTLVGPGGATVAIAYVIAQTAVPVILAPNGTVATNGTITLGTALPTIYAKAWVYLPAGAVVAGLAGLYYATFSSTTVGVITTTYTSTASAFTPYIPTGTAVATGSNAAYTQTTAADITLANITVPGGMMGANGALRIWMQDARNGTANSKISKSILGGGINSIQFLSSASASTVSVGDVHVLRNRGVANAQTVFTPGWAGGGGTSSAVGAYYAIDTSTDKALTFTGQLAVATDYIVLEGFTVEVLPKA